MQKSIGFILLGIYLLLIGVLALFGLQMGGASFIVPCLAIGAGLFILLGR